MELHCEWVKRLSEVGRRFPPKGATLRPTKLTDISAAQRLGRRVERLFLTGLILTGLAFGEFYLATANLRLSKDRDTVAVATLLAKAQENFENLNQLYRDKSIPKLPSPPPPTKSELDARQLRIEASRKLLGLPPAKPTIAVDANPIDKTESYEDFLSGLVGAAVKETDADPRVLQSYSNPDIAPAKLVDELSAAVASAEKQPITVLGVRVPRLIAIDYAGSNFSFPYEVLSVALLVVLTPLTAGWLSALYMTRQREIREIVKAESVSAVFPHVLNFVPVLLRSQVSLAAQRNTVIGITTFQALMRFCIMIVVVGPLLLFFALALIQFSNYATVSSLVWVFLIYIFVQTFCLILQELVGFGWKVFWEG